MQTADDIREKRFLIALRGYDRDEVEAYLDQLATQVATMQAELAAANAARDEAMARAANAGGQDVGAVPAESGAAAVQMGQVNLNDRVALLQTLGEETTRILTVAEQSAAEIRDKAEREAAELRATAEAETTELRANAASETTELRETTEAQVAELRETTEAEVAELRAQAEAEARELRETAKAEAREAAEQANRQASRVISEAERRRDRMAAEIHAVDEQRLLLIDNLQGAVDSITSTVSELQQGSRDPGAEGEPDEEPAPAGAVAAPEAAADTETAPADVADAEAAPAESEAVEPSDDEPAGAGREDPDATVDDADLTVEDDSHAHEASADATAVAVVETVEVVETPTGEVAAVETVELVEVPEELVEVAEAEQDAADEPEAAVEPDGADVDDVAESVADEVAEDLAPAEEEAPDAGVAELQGDMIRELRRGLQSVQSGVLESIRTTKDADVDALLPSDPSLDELGQLAESHFEDAYTVAVITATERVDGQVPGELNDSARVPAATATFRAVLAHEVTSSLRPTLRAGLEAEESETSLSERVGEVFRDLKGPVLESLASQHLSRAYGHGLLDAWQALGVESLQWVVGSESRCPENRCAANADSGAVAIGDDFPSGDRVPPAHPGCTCTITPA